jgi:hypothetical protein
MAADRFVAKHDDQDMKISRAIWYYGLDFEHSFSRYHESIRWNLVAMAILMVNNFPSEYCPAADTKRFVLAYFEAWLSTLVVSGTLKQRSFRAQENFIKIWKEGELDLIHFKRAEHKKITNRMGEMKVQSLPPALLAKIDRSPEEIVTMRRDGRISDEEFMKYGPTMVDKYLFVLSETDMAVRMKKMSDEDILDEEMGKKVASEYGQHGAELRRVNWNSRLVDSLLGCADDAMPPAVKIRNRGRTPSQREAWLDKEGFFEVIGAGLVILEEETEDMCDMFGEASLAS